MDKNIYKGKAQIMRNIGENNNRNKFDILLIDAHKNFINYKKIEGLRERTINDHKLHFNYFNKWLLNLDINYKEFCVSDINLQHCRDYITYMLNKGLSPVTINIRLRTLKCFLRFLEDEEIIHNKIAEKIKLLKVNNDNEQNLKEVHLKSLLKAIDRKTYTGFRDYVIIMVLLDTGCRISEGIAITKSQIDFNECTIYLLADKVKTRKGRRVPLSRKTVKLLNDLINLNSSVNDMEEIFLSVYGTPFQAKSFRKRLQKYIKQALIPNNIKITPHSFRHYFAKNYILNGGDPFTLQKILGHSDMQMVRRYILMTDIDIKIKHNKYSPVQRF